MEYKLPPYRHECPPAASLKELTGQSTFEWWSEQMGVPQILLEQDGAGFSAAVLDTGASLNHPALKHNIASAVDMTGWRNAEDDQGHGSHVGGLIAGNGDDFKGIAPAAGLHIVRVLDRNGSGQSNWIANGIDYAIKKEVDIINMSLGGPVRDNRIAAAVKRAVQAGIVVMCAAGNDGIGRPVNYPGALANTIAVSALNRHGAPADFTCTGPEVDVAAYGEDIRSTYKNGKYAILSGTSMACPIATGAAILIMASKKAAGIDYKAYPTNVREFLRETAKDMGRPGKDHTYGFGVWNPEDMIQPSEEHKPGPPADPDDDGEDTPSDPTKIDLEIRIGGQRYGLVPLD